MGPLNPPPFPLSETAKAIVGIGVTPTSGEQSSFRSLIDVASATRVVSLESIVTGSLQSITPGTLSVVNIGGSRIVAPAVGQHLLIQNRTPGVAGRVHIEPNGRIENGTTAKLDVMLDPYNDDPANYRIGNIFGYTGVGPGLNGQNGVIAITAKAVGDNFGISPSINLGFGDDSATGGGALKMMYFDTGDTAWRTPMRGAWVTALAVTSGDYMLANFKLYQSGTTGTTGTTKPSHTSGTVSDGAINWTFIRDFTGGAGFAPAAVIGNRDDMPLFGHPTVRMQILRDALLSNGNVFKFLSNTGVTTWTVGAAVNTADFSITNLNAAGGVLRFGALGFLQLNGLSSLLVPKALSANSATPDISKTELLRLDNTVATTVTSFAGGLAYQRFFVFAGNGNTTFQHSASILLADGQNRTMATGEIIQFIMNAGGTVAHQVTGERPVTSAVQTPGTTGAVTQHTDTGRVNFAAGATSLAVTNNLVNSNSIIIPSKVTNDSTARIGAIVPDSGFFTIYMDVPSAVECTVSYTITKR